MGRKSRSKRERKKDKAMPIGGVMPVSTPFAHDAEFQRHASDLMQQLARYNAEDVGIALAVSDLWLPNISSQIKHQFALGVFAEMNEDRFAATRRISTYEEFSSFIQGVYGGLPAFPSLEDFVPEPDWGEIRAECDGEFRRMFYGCSVERIPDFVDAFRLRYEGNDTALNDMSLVIRLQESLIGGVSRDVVGSAMGLSPGHLETPSREFWIQCREAIVSAADALTRCRDGISPALVLQVGKFKRPATWASFGDAVMTGASMPAVIICAGNKPLPLSTRNATSVVIDYWAQRGEADATALNADLTGAVAKFLSRRLDDRSVTVGPLRLVSRSERLPHRIAGVLRTAHTFVFIVVIDVDALATLETIVQEVNRIVSNGTEWAFLFEGTSNAVQFRRADGGQPGKEDITILAVLSRVATSWLTLALPRTTARVVSLPDFVTLIDSLEDADELEKFWAFVDSHKSLLGPMSGGVADLFGAFRDSSGLLVDGAIAPTFISLDPHWGSNWRYKVLSQFWAVAPRRFPDNSPTWKVEAPSDGLQSLIAKGRPSIAWSTNVGGCVVQSVFQLWDQTLDLLNGRMLELFVHCLADAFSQRRRWLEGHLLFHRDQIVLMCRACMSSLAKESDDESSAQDTSEPLYRNWRLDSGPNGVKLVVSVDVNLARVQLRLQDPADASFEAECLCDAISGLSSLLGIVFNAELKTLLLDTSSRKPRFTVKRVVRSIDVPDFTVAEVPSAEQYKVARRELAIVLKGRGVEPGRYELANAKAIIDSARDEMRDQIHKRVADLNRQALLLFCIQQHDALTAEYRREEFRLTQSLQHEVSFDRAEALAKALDTFTRNARNYRYLLECCVSAPLNGSGSVSAQSVVQLIALIDWLFVLYGASDVLHNGIDVGGIELDQSYVPQIFFSDDKEAREKKFGEEVANAKLGVELRSDDEVNSAQEGGEQLGDLDRAFFADLGFSLSHLTQMLFVLAQWQTARGETELALSYSASVEEMLPVLLTTIEGLSKDEARRLIRFATLDPALVRRLLGKTLDELDVPVWEHNKRWHRYNIRPLITIGDGQLAWGAAAAERAARIWMNSIFNGYMPADFDWPQISSAVREVKEKIEGQLELVAFEVCARATSSVLHGIDFKYRFPSERFEDVGDFDVLAYWPELNRWLYVECKYNQPPFCLKDARRLRDRIFGSGVDHGQFAKIERRLKFLCDQCDRLRALLKWPDPPSGTLPRVGMVYVSRDIYWWMRNPPYVVPTQFVRIDGMDRWLREEGLLVEGNGNAVGPHS